MHRLVLLLSVAALLAACSTSRIGDPRAQALLILPVAQHYAERVVARELADRCGDFVYDIDLADDMDSARADSANRPRAAIGLEADIKRRSLAARYGRDIVTIDSCWILQREIEANTPLSVMVIDA
jgi:hypothetical protein